jgi:hypothetical protein
MMERHSVRLCIAALAAICMACANDLRGTIHEESAGFFMVSYRPWRLLLDDYGPGTEAVRRRVQVSAQASAKQVWDEAFSEAVPRFLEARKMTPPQCPSGVIVIHVEESEGGSGWARVRCK